VRFHAAEWHINPHKIGVIGFSAGGHMVAATSTHFDKRLYPAIDAADKVSCRPDFAIALYPGHLSPFHPDDPDSWTHENQLELNPNVRVRSNTPPTFLLQAQNDRVDDIRNSMAYSLALRNAKVPVELHLYAEGGHGFGLRRTRFPITEWPALVEKWLGTIGMISQQMPAKITTNEPDRANRPEPSSFRRQVGEGGLLGLPAAIAHLEPDEKTIDPNGNFHLS